MVDRRKVNMSSGLIFLVDLKKSEFCARNISFSVGGKQETVRGTNIAIL